ncbi:MAG: flagellar motor protein MotA [Beijerinckiaceae bacterium]|nr:flagellar motor protein MotA [Beijerinckiaceae bacterium]
MAKTRSGRRLTSPGLFLFRMIVFLVLGGLLLAVMQKQIQVAFWANPGLNGVIGLVLFLGIVFSFAQVGRLFREIRWVNSRIEPDETRPPPPEPILLAPMAALLGDRIGRTGISTMTLRSVLDSIGGRLDESRELARYLTGLLVFLGLLGTFWGLIETVSSIGTVIEKLPSAGENNALFDELKRNLAAPLSGMGIAFSSSLFGLGGSLTLGFLDLQAGQAQSRFFYEVEEWLSSAVQDQPAAIGANADLRQTLDGISRAVSDAGAGRNASQSIANLAEGIQAMVQHMRNEQQMIRNWVEAQAAQQADVKRLLEKLTQESSTPPADKKAE